ncbi:MAG: hypothetical protein QW038_02335 [Nanopusillaceae archaeon]
MLINSYWILPTIYKSFMDNIKISYNFSLEEIDRLSKLNNPSNVFQMIGGGGWKSVLKYPPTITKLSIFSHL